MARTNRGILGDVTGKVGTVIGSSWNGISYVRSLPTKKKNRRRTEPQIEQQAKFALAADFYRSMTPILKVSFQKEAGITGRNAAVRELLAKAIGGVYPDFLIDYSKVLVAKGNLLAVENPSVASNAPGKLTFSWTDESGLGNAMSTDKAILIAYDKERNVAIATTNGAERSAGASELTVQFFSGKQVHTWIAFRSANGKLSSDSRYTGPVLVQ